MSMILHFINIYLYMLCICCLYICSVGYKRSTRTPVCFRIIVRSIFGDLYAEYILSMNKKWFMFRRFIGV